MAHSSDRGLGTNGADDYPYDSSLSVLELQGLERLRVVADRQLAQYLYVLHTQAERNSVASGPMRPTKKPLRTEATERLAQRALSGELGPDARELAAYILLDEYTAARAPASLPLSSAGKPAPSVSITFAVTAGITLRDARRSQPRMIPSKTQVTTKPAALVQALATPPPVSNKMGAYQMPHMSP